MTRRFELRTTELRTTELEEWCKEQGDERYDQLAAAQKEEGGVQVLLYMRHVLGEKRNDDGDFPCVEGTRATMAHLEGHGGGRDAIRQLKRYRVKFV